MGDLHTALTDKYINNNLITRYALPMYEIDIRDLWLRKLSILENTIGNKGKLNFTFFECKNSIQWIALSIA